LTATQLSKARWDEIRTFLRNFPFFLVSIVLPLAVTHGLGDKVTLQCTKQVVPWLYVQAIVHLFYSLKAVLMVTVLLKSAALRLHKHNFNLGFMLTVILFEIAWLVYGSTFHYSETTYNCKELGAPFSTLWTLMMIELAMGYVIFLTTTLTSLGSNIHTLMMIRRRRIAL